MCQHVCQQNESNNWKNWPWLLFHEQHIKGSLLYEIYRQGKFKVGKRKLSGLTTHNTAFSLPSALSLGKRRKQDRCLQATWSVVELGLWMNTVKWKVRVWWLHFKQWPKAEVWSSKKEKEQDGDKKRISHRGWFVLRNLDIFLQKMRRHWSV